MTCLKIQISCYTSSDKLYCKLCLRNVNWRRAKTHKDHLRSEAQCGKQGKRHEAQNFNQLKWKKQNLEKIKNSQGPTNV